MSRVAPCHSTSTISRRLWPAPPTAGTLPRDCRPQPAQAEQLPRPAAAAAAAATATVTVTGRQPLGVESLVGSRVVARTYAYLGEEACEKHVQSFMSAIDTAANLPGQVRGAT